MIINDLIYQRLGFLDKTDVNTQSVIEASKKESFAIIGYYLKKLAPYDEGAYNDLEKLLVAYYVSYNMLKKRISLKVAGNNEGANKIVKRKKADVVEIEYAVLKGLDLNSVCLSHKQDLCNQAKLLGIVLPLCYEGQTDKGGNTIIVPPKVYN